MSQLLIGGIHVIIRRFNLNILEETYEKTNFYEFIKFGSISNVLQNDRILKEELFFPGFRAKVPFCSKFQCELFQRFFIFFYGFWCKTHPLCSKKLKINIWSTFRQPLLPKCCLKGFIMSKNVQQ